MAIRNSAMLDHDNGIFSVLDFVIIQLPRLTWQGEDFDFDTGKGAIFHGFHGDEIVEGQPEAASVTVADVTLDSGEPDVSTLRESDVHRFGQREGTSAHRTEDDSQRPKNRGDFDVRHRNEGDARLATFQRPEDSAFQQWGIAPDRHGLSVQARPAPSFTTTGQSNPDQIFDTMRPSEKWPAWRSGRGNK